MKSSLSRQDAMFGTVKVPNIQWLTLPSLLFLARLPAERDHKILNTFDIHDSGSDSIRSSKKKNGPGTTNLRNGRTNNCWQPDYFLIFFHGQMEFFEIGSLRNSPRLTRAKITEAVDCLRLLKTQNSDCYMCLLNRQSAAISSFSLSYF